MSTRATASFDVTGWDATPYEEPAEGPHLSRVTIRKVFRGDLDGESTGEGLFCALSDPGAGAGYVVSERVVGTLDGRNGTFVLQHGGLVGDGLAPRSFGHVVPGSGTGGLAGLRGEATFSAAEGGGHTLVLDYDLD
jgi:hypothetical protein